jgi:hypothetical protein
MGATTQGNRERSTEGSVAGHGDEPSSRLQAIAQRRGMAPSLLGRHRERQLSRSLCNARPDLRRYEQEQVW